MSLEQEHQKQNKRNIVLEYVKIIVYGIIAPSILSYGIYYTCSSGVKEAVKEGLVESLRESFDISKKIQSIYKSV